MKRLAIVAVIAASRMASAQEADLDEVSKKLSNPVASLVSIPFQGNADYGFGQDDHGSRHSLNLQPVVPISLSDDWNLISHTILPIITQEDVFPDSSESGVGNLLQSFFLSPKEPGPFDLIWGVGPIIQLPTATDERLGVENYGIGPTAVVLRQDSGFTYGMLFNHLWARLGESDEPDVSASFVQPFASYAVARGMTLTANLESSYDWVNEEWTVPFNLVLSQVVPISGQLVSFFVGARYYFDAPDDGPDWGLRLGFTLLFPK